MATTRRVIALALGLAALVAAIVWRRRGDDSYWTERKPMTFRAHRLNLNWTAEARD